MQYGASEQREGWFVAFTTAQRTPRRSGRMLQGTFKPGDRVLFLHTGGAPSLFHYKPLESAE